MKKLIAIFLAVLMLPFGTLAADLSFYQPTSRGIISGTVTNNNVPVSVLLFSDNNSNSVFDDGDEVAYATELTADYNGNYQLRFKYSGNVDKCKLLLRQDNEIINNTVKRAVLESEIFDASANIVYSADNTAELRADIDNLYGANSTFTVIIANYDASNNLIGCSVKKDISMNDGKQSEYLCKTKDENTDHIKAFIWKDLTSVIPLAKAGEETAMERFKDGDVVTVIGSSNTSAEYTQVAYMQFINYFYQIRYPKETVKFYNAGIAGDSAIGATQRLDWDILDPKYIKKTPNKAIIQIGTNDMNYGQYPREDGVNTTATESAANGLAKLLDALLAKSITPTYMSVVGVYDGYYPKGNATTYAGAGASANDGLTYLTELDGQKCADRGLRMVDVYSYMQWARANYSGEFMVSPDRIHANTPTHLAEMYLFLKEQGMSSTVAQVELSGFEASTVNAEVTNLQKNGDNYAYTYKPGSLPFATSDDYKNVDNSGFAPLTAQLNREIIKINDASEGTYSISMNGTQIGTYSADELKNGVNIATNELNPYQVQSKTVYKDLVTDYYTPMHNLRRLAYQKQFLRQRSISYDDFDYTTLTKGDGNYENSNVYKYYLANNNESAADTVMGLFKEEKSDNQEMLNLESTARTNAVISPCDVVITKIN